MKVDQLHNYINEYRDDQKVLKVEIGEVSKLNKEKKDKLENLKSQLYQLMLKHKDKKVDDSVAQQDTQETQEDIKA